MLIFVICTYLLLGSFIVATATLSISFSIYKYLIILRIFFTRYVSIFLPSVYLVISRIPSIPSFRLYETLEKKLNRRREDFILCLIPIDSIHSVDPITSFHDMRTLLCFILYYITLCLLLFALLFIINIY